jgi:hypothetical protein
MTTDDVESSPPAVPDTEQQPWWAQPWSGAEKRLLMITLLGGLGAGLGIVIVLALAVLVAHGLTWFFRNSMEATLPGAFAYLTVSLYLVAMIRLLVYSRTRKASKRIALAVNINAVGGLLVLLLGVIGYLAGIR